MKKLLMVLGVLFLLLLLAGGGAAAYFLLNPGKVKEAVQGESRLLDYLGAQVVGIANAQLVPELSFETIRYDPPYTLGLGGVKLVAADGTRVLDLGRMTVRLAETPRMGEPLKIAEVNLADGAVNLIQDPATGGFRGMSPLVEPGPDREKTEEVSPAFSLSNVLRLDKVVIDGIDLVYDAGDGSTPMRLDALSANLDIVPATDMGGPGWYELKLASGREPGLELDLDGRINIETFELALNRVEAEAELDDQTATTLPPQLATLIGEHQVRGAMRAVVTGRVPLLEPERAELSAEVGLDQGRAVFGEYQVPIDSLHVNADFASGVVNVASVQAESMGGRLKADGRLTLGGDAVMKWDVSDMDLREMLASRPADQPPKMAGKVTTTGSVRAPLEDPLAGVSGAGSIAVTEGRLVNVPVLSELVKVIQVTGLIPGRVFNDSFTSPMTISPAGVRLENFDFRTPAIAARGSGTLGFDGGLNFSVNGGPVEALQNKLGKFGSVLGIVTDQLVTYRVRGDVSNPAVSVQPLGIGG